MYFFYIIVSYVMLNYFFCKQCEIIKCEVWSANSKVDLQTPCYMKKLPMKSKFILNFFCSLKSLAVAVWIINPTSKKKLGSNLNGTNIWDSSYIMVFFQTYQLLVISLCGTCSKYNYICYDPWNFLPGHISLFYGGNLMSLSPFHP